MLYRAFEALGAARIDRDMPSLKLTSPRREALRQAVPALIGPLVLSGLAATLAGRLGKGHWILDLFSHFPLHIALGLGLLALAALALGRRRLALVAILGLVWNASLLGPRYLPPADAVAVRAAAERGITDLGSMDRSATDRGITDLGAADRAAAARAARALSAPSPPAPALDILIFNILRINPRKAAVMAWIRAEEPDILGLIEVDEAWLAAVERELPEYEILKAVAAPRDDNFGMLLALRRDRPGLALESARLREDMSRPPRVVPAIEARFRVDGQPLDLLLVHTMPPKGGWHTAMRDHQLAEAVAWAEETGRAPALVAGDFNLTPFSPRFARMLEGSRLIDSGRGRGYQSSWPFMPLRLLGIPIDHALYTPGIQILERRIGPGFGSDHGALCLRVGLSLPSSPGPFSHEGRRGVGGDWAGGVEASVIAVERLK